ncbi:MAG: ArsR family transcriptional regulator [Vulcanisaeta sp.]|uniref:ArsR family transcriptional regulator n=1 Tax=Vulcanisaeta moutnovskia (strain 768-28) TaxID=985053 RepID=F0QUG2_VULM7|nr:ArsR family transcriptional regulator [Vulcanisaeta moutnovskia]ADY01871.1 ArsR family transcriptional regulator [Vulcanisaeta moutnovskia 768-28]
MSRDIDDIDNIVLKPRRIQILKLLIGQGTMRISDLRKVLNAPTSSIYYDIEILRANGFVIRDGPYVKITSKGRTLIERIDELLSPNSDIKNPSAKTEELTDILLMRPLTINMYRLGPNALFIYSMVIIVLGLVTAFTQNYELLLLVFVESMYSMPIDVTIISILAYLGISLFIYRYLLGGEIVDLKLLSGVLTSLIPISLYPTIMALITPWVPPYPLSIIDALLKALLPLISLIMLATVLSMISGKPMEYSLLFETLFLLIPSVLIYIVLFK